MTDSLRIQTQKRTDTGVIGAISDTIGNDIIYCGVGEYNEDQRKDERGGDFLFRGPGFGLDGLTDARAARRRGAQAGQALIKVLLKIFFIHHGTIPPVGF